MPRLRAARLRYLWKLRKGAFLVKYHHVAAANFLKTLAGYNVPPILNSRTNIIPCGFKVPGSLFTVIRIKSIG
jgi:hypothetical protein